MRCPNCDAEETTQIEIQLRGEDTVQFFSCRRCEHKWWEREGGSIELDEVLLRAAAKNDS